MAQLCTLMSLSSFMARPKKIYESVGQISQYPYFDYILAGAESDVSSPSQHTAQVLGSGRSEVPRKFLSSMSGHNGSISLLIFSDSDYLSLRAKQGCVLRMRT